MCNFVVNVIIITYYINININSLITQTISCCPIYLKRLVTLCQDSNTSFIARIKQSFVKLKLLNNFTSHHT